MASSIAKVSSAALTELQSDLTRLSSTLHKIYELMNADMRQVNVAWQDAKYQEFVQNYQPQIQKCEDIANRYSEWCTRVLNPTIENVVAVERTDVGGSGGLNGGSSPSGMVGGTTATAAVGGSGLVGSVKMNGAKNPSSNSESGVIIAQAVSEAKTNNTTKPKLGELQESVSGDHEKGIIQKAKEYLFGPEVPEATQKCQKTFGEDYRGKPTDGIIHVRHGETKSGGQYEIGGSVEASAKAPLVGGAAAEAKAGIQAKYKSGSKTTNEELDYDIQCVRIENNN